MRKYHVDEIEEQIRKSVVNYEKDFNDPLLIQPI